ncbi:MAG: hypothetical protein RL189_953 [Pseudomonadota bacterium]|jgi:hypothetical protein
MSTRRFYKKNSGSTKKTHHAAMSWCAFLACLPLTSMADTTLQMYAPMQNTEFTAMLPVAPRADFSVSKSIEKVFSAAAQISTDLQSRRSREDSGIKARELRLTAEADSFRLSMGKLLIRPNPSAFVEPFKDFLQEEPSAEGLGYEWKWSDGKASLFLESDFSFALAQQFSGLHVSALHRIELNRLTNNGETIASRDAALTRAVRTHDTELQLKMAGDDIESESLLQIRAQGASRLVTPAPDVFSKPIIGALDPSLPSSVTDYRLATQLRSRAGRSLQTSGWYVYGIAARNTLTSYAASETTTAARKANSSSYLFSFALDLESQPDKDGPTVFGQLGIGIESSSEKKYRFLGRFEDGEPVYVKGKFISWFTTRYRI